MWSGSHLVVPARSETRLVWTSTSCHVASVVVLGPTDGHCHLLQLQRHVPYVLAGYLPWLFLILPPSILSFRTFPVHLQILKVEGRLHFHLVQVWRLNMVETWGIHDTLTDWHIARPILVGPVNRDRHWTLCQCNHTQSHLLCNTLKTILVTLRPAV